MSLFISLLAFIYLCISFSSYSRGTIRTGQRMPAKLHARILRLQKKFASQTEARIKKGATANDAYTDNGRKFMRQAFKIALDGTPSAKKLTADCDTHSCKCPVLPTPPKSFLGLLCSASGVSCIDWSKMGKKKK